MTGFHHLWCVDVEYTLVMCFVIFSENFMKLLAWFVAVSLAGLLSHFNSTIRHKCTFQRFVCLQTNYLLQIFHAVIDICCAVSCDSAYNVCLHIQNAAFCTLFFLEFL